eukprot:TRINITY_DN1795_c3_g1_i1.p1 TRINITY_DN1795_c3_g1~~TRINITY_DN1795_c3_g1_i1.p1  ORF type:complete len:971 (-),score=246.81 TRINITY_DN1795_c3_g1_i1:65-2977(-)
MFKKKSITPKYISKSKNQSLANTSVTSVENDDIYITSTYDRTTTVSVSSVLSGSSPVIIQPDGVPLKNYATGDVYNSAMFSAVVFNAKQANQLDRLLIIDLVNDIPLHMLEFDGKIKAIASNNAIDLFVVFTDAGSIFSVDPISGESDQSSTGKKIKKNVKAALISHEVAALLQNEQSLKFFNVLTGECVHKDSLEDKYWITIQVQNERLICTSVVGVYIWTKNGDRYKRTEFGTKSAASCILIHEEDLYVGQINGRIDKHELSTAEHLSPIAPAVESSSSKKGMKQATEHMIIDMAIKDQYLVVLSKTSIRIFYENMCIKEKTFRKPLSNGSMFLEDYDSLVSRIITKVDKDVRLGQWKLRRSQLKVLVKDANKKKKYEWMSNSLSISPTVLNHMFSSDVFLGALLSIAVEGQSGARIGKSMLKLYNENNKLDTLVISAITAEFESVNSGKLLEANYERGRLVNESIFFQYFPTSGFSNADVLFLESRFTTMLLDDLFHNAGSSYIRKVLKNQFQEVLRIPNILEVEPVTISRLHGLSGEDDKEVIAIASENAVQLREIAKSILETLIENIDTFPPILATALHTIYDLANRLMTDQEEDQRLKKSVGRIVGSYLGKVVINPPLGRKTALSQIQRRNLSLIGNLLHTCTNGLPASFPAFRGFDEEENLAGQWLTSVATIGVQGSSGSKFKMIPRDYVYLGRFLKNNSAALLEHLPEGSEVTKLVSKLYEDDTVKSGLGEGVSVPDRSYLERADDETKSKFAAVLPVRFAPDYPPDIDESKKQDILYGNMFAKHPGDYDNLVDWINAERRYHDFILIVLYRGEWCPWCERYVKEWNKYAAKIIAGGGLIVGLSSQSQSSATKNCAKWEIGYPLLGEPENVLALTYNMKTQKIVGYPYGMANPGLVAVDSEGSLIYHWVAYPSFSNYGGQTERPLATNVLDDIFDELAADDIDETSVSSATELSTSFVSDTD